MATDTASSVASSNQTPETTHFSVGSDALAKKRQAEARKFTNPVDIIVELMKKSFHMLQLVKAIGVNWLAEAMGDVCRTQHKLITNSIMNPENCNDLNKVMDFVESLQVNSRRFMALFDTLSAEDYGSVSVVLSTLYEMEYLVYLMRCICLKKKALGWGVPGCPLVK